MQAQVVAALMNPGAYEEDPGQIKQIQTHISFIFLTKDFVYKVKKAVNLGFLDFTTLEKRRFFCKQELELNRRLCHGMYLEVVPINKSTVIRIKGEGETVEYALKMVKMPQDKMMNKLLEKRRVDSGLVDKIAKIIVDFHSESETNRAISKFGSVATLEFNWKENFEQTREFVDSTISSDDYRLVQGGIKGFIKKNMVFFGKRMMEGRVRDCHGDIHSGNIFVTDKIYIFDAIEFNERFRYSDVASDIAFLAMDLDFKGRTDLSEFFVKKYIEYSKDPELAKLLVFYKCYRAYVRGKVISFKLNDSNVSKMEKAVAMKEARAYFKLAVNYAKALHKVTS